jgi:hypothetical protein
LIEEILIGLISKKPAPLAVAILFLFEPERDLKYNQDRKNA